MRQREMLKVEPDHVALIRRLRVNWARAELGAPFFQLAPPEISEADLCKMVRKILGRPNLSEGEALTLHREAWLAVPAFVALSTLEPGTYSVENRFDPNELNDQPFIVERLCRVGDGRVTIEVSDQSLRLVRHAQVVVGDDGGTDVFGGVDPKHPYGDDRHFYNDMAKILAMAPDGPRDDDDDPRSPRELSQRQIDELDGLHYLSQGVLQVMFETAGFGPGEYRQEPPHWGHWTAVAR